MYDIKLECDMYSENEEEEKTVYVTHFLVSRINCFDTTKSRSKKKRSILSFSDFCGFD